MLKKRQKLSVEAFKKESFIKTVKGKLLSLKIKDNNKDFSRFNLIISLKYDKRAAYRNRFKRALFEWIRSNLEAFPSGKDILILLSPLAKSDLKIESFLNDLKEISKNLK